VRWRDLMVLCVVAVLVLIAVAYLIGVTDLMRRLP